jgi:hypothetical protein
MAENQAKKRRTPSAPRQADFTVKSQLLGKLGPGGYGRLLDKLRAVAPEEGQ